MIARTRIQTIIAAALAADSNGIWLLNGAAPLVEYAAPPTDQEQRERTAFVGLSELEALMQDDDMRALDLHDAGRVLIIRLPGPDDSMDYGLTTVQPAAGYCRVCGCSESNPCETGPGACYWVEAGLCSACADRPMPTFGYDWPAIRARVLARLAETSPDHPWLKEETP